MNYWYIRIGTVSGGLFKTNFKYKQVTKVLRQKGRIATAHGQFNRVRQIAPMYLPICTCFLGPTRVHNPNGISIGLTGFAGLTIVTEIPTDRQTDHATLSVTVVSK